jgi:hypothetical protein
MAMVKLSSIFDALLRSSQQQRNRQIGGIGDRPSPNGFRVIRIGFGGGGAAKIGGGRRLLGAEDDEKMAEKPAAAEETLRFPEGTCAMWRQTANCDPTGAREADGDRSCETVIKPGTSGFCECGNGAPNVQAVCKHAPFTCEAACKRGAEMILERKCVGWRHTGGCDPKGTREPDNDKQCTDTIAAGASGYCECDNGVRIGATCEHDPFQCSYACENGVIPGAPHIKAKVSSERLDKLVTTFLKANADERQAIWKDKVLDLTEDQQHDFIERHRVRAKETEDEEAQEWDRKHQEEIQKALGRDGLEHAGHQEEGCLLTGFLEVRRVPGSVVIEAFSPWHEFASHKLSANHEVKHFSFGEVGATAMVVFGQEENKAGGMDEQAQLHTISTLSGKSFTSVEAHHTHEHYLKVVETQVEHYQTKHLDHFSDHHVYRYSASSHEYKEDSDMPKIKFTYDMDPMGVLVQDVAMPFYKFLTSVCAIIGGAFTMFGLLDGFVFHSMRTLQKKMELGKAN